MKNDILQKIKKLKAKAEGSTFEGEAKVFMKKATELMIKHGISEAELDTETDQEDMVDDIVNPEDSRVKRFKSWKGFLVIEIANNFGCAVIKRNQNIIINGEKRAVETVKFLYNYCLEAIENEVNEKARGNGKAYMNSFRLGCIKEIGRSMAEEREAQISKDARALVVVNNMKEKVKEATRDYQDRHNCRLGGGTRPKHNMDPEGYSRGREAGKGIYGARRGKVSGQQGRITNG